MPTFSELQKSTADIGLGITIALFLVFSIIIILVWQLRNAQKHQENSAREREATAKLHAAERESAAKQHAAEREAVDKRHATEREAAAKLHAAEREAGDKRHSSEREIAERRYREERAKADDRYAADRDEWRQTIAAMTARFAAAVETNRMELIGELKDQTRILQRMEERTTNLQPSARRTRKDTTINEQ